MTDRISFGAHDSSAMNNDLNLQNLIVPGLRIVNGYRSSSIQNGPANFQLLGIPDEQAKLEEEQKNSRRLELMFKLDRERKALIEELSANPDNGQVKIDLYIKLFEESLIALKHLRPSFRIN